MSRQQIRKIILLICLPLLMIYCMFKISKMSNSLDEDYTSTLQKPRNELKHDVRINFRKQSECYKVQMVNKAVVESEDLDNYIDVCESSNKLDRKDMSSQLCPSCRFKSLMLVKELKPFIALASFPGSGNSWTRELFESVTGIYTGSIYKDGMGEFIGSRRCPLRGGVYIIKTHEHDNKIKHTDCKAMHETRIDYQKAMLILRNPYDAMLSLFNLRSNRNKTGFADQEQFKSERWRTFVHVSAKRWRTMNLYWLTKFENPLHVLVYEELTTRTITELFNAGRFLNLDNTYLDLYCAKYCLKPTYHRVKPEWMTKSMLFDNDMREIVNSEVNKLLNEIKDREHIERALKNYIMKTNPAKLIRSENLDE